MNAPTPLIPCPQCGRHYKATDTSCPFCGDRGNRLSTQKLMRTAAVGLSAFVLMACYGAPPGDFMDTGPYDTGTTDLDGDGYTVQQGDCDDADAAINPDATEVCDDTVDNDCDDKIDAKDEDCATD